MEEKETVAYVKEKIKAVHKEILSANLLIGFYKTLSEKEEDEKKKSAYELKISKIEEDIKFNQGFIEFASKYQP